MSWTLQDEFDDAVLDWFKADQPDPEHAARLLEWYSTVRLHTDLDIGYSRELNEQYGTVPPIPTTEEARWASQPTQPTNPK